MPRNIGITDIAGWKSHSAVRDANSSPKLAWGGFGELKRAMPKEYDVIKLPAPIKKCSVEKKNVSP